MLGWLKDHDDDDFDGLATETAEEETRREETLWEKYNFLFRLSTENSSIYFEFLYARQFLRLRSKDHQRKKVTKEEDQKNWWKTAKENYEELKTNHFEEFATWTAGTTKDQEERRTKV